MSTLANNKEPKGEPLPSVEAGSGKICVLLRDGRLFGIFSSRENALYWCSANELDGFSTYDLISPDVQP